MTDWAQRDWWPLHIALAWMIAPELIKVKRVSAAKTTTSIVQEVSFDFANVRRNIGGERHSNGSNLDFGGAWERLRVAGADGKVEMRGALVRRQSGPPPRSAEAAEPDVLIPAAELSRIMHHA